MLKVTITKEELAELANCNGQAVEIGLKKGGQDDSNVHKN